jgi:hypothetical protein
MSPNPSKLDRIAFEEVLQFVPHTTHKLVTPLLFEVNFYETMRGYNRQQMLDHLTQKYITKEPFLQSRYDITVRD